MEVVLKDLAVLVIGLDFRLIIIAACNIFTGALLRRDLMLRFGKFRLGVLFC